MMLRSLCHNHTVLLIFWICIMCQARISLNIKISFPLRELQVTAVNLGSLYSARPRRWKLEWSMLTTGRNTYICCFKNCYCREASWLDTPLQRTRLLFNHYSWALVVLPLSCTVCMYTYVYVRTYMYFTHFQEVLKAVFAKFTILCRNLQILLQNMYIYGEFCKKIWQTRNFQTKKVLLVWGYVFITICWMSMDIPLGIYPLLIALFMDYIWFRILPWVQCCYYISLRRHLALSLLLEEAKHYFPLDSKCMSMLLSTCLFSQNCIHGSDHLVTYMRLPQAIYIIKVFCIHCHITFYGSPTQSSTTAKVNIQVCTHNDDSLLTLNSNFVHDAININIDIHTYVVNHM